MYSTPHRTPSNEDNFNKHILVIIYSYYRKYAAENSVFLEGAMLLGECDQTFRRHNGPSKLMRPLAQQLIFQTQKIYVHPQKVVIPCSLASMLLHDPTSSQPKFQNRCFSLEDKTFKIFNIWPINPPWYTDTIYQWLVSTAVC
jgi:hypothetical protein